MSQFIKRNETLASLLKLVKSPKSLMEDDFKKIEEAGINSVGALLQWLTDAKIIDQAAETHAKVEKMFSDVADETNVEFVKFQEVVGKIAEEKNEELEAVNKKLVEALKAGIEAFASTLEDTKRK